MKVIEILIRIEPNEATEDQIIETCTKAKEKLLKK